MEFIIDSPKYGRHTVLIDDEDAERVLKYKWYVNYQSYGRSKQKIRAVVTSGKVNGKRVKISLHRLLCPSAEIVDHIDGNPLNNQKNNLRSCTVQDNAHNRGKSVINKTGYKGVSIQNGKAKAHISFANVKIHLGYFDTLKEAAVAYNKAALKYHGKFARLNEI